MRRFKRAPNTPISPVFQQMTVFVMAVILSSAGLMGLVAFAPVTYASPIVPIEAPEPEHPADTAPTMYQAKLPVFIDELHLTPPLLPTPG